MLIPFSLISSWGFQQINKANLLGVKPGYTLDLFGLNLFIQFMYCFTGFALYLYWLAPIYAIYQIVNLVGPYICPKMFGRGGDDPNLENSDKGKSKRQLKKEQLEASGRPQVKTKFMK